MLKYRETEIFSFPLNPQVDSRRVWREQVTESTIQRYEKSLCRSIFIHRSLDLKTELLDEPITTDQVTAWRDARGQRKLKRGTSTSERHRWAQCWYPTLTNWKRSFIYKRKILSLVQQLKLIYATARQLLADYPCVRSFKKPVSRWNMWLFLFLCGDTVPSIYRTRERRQFCCRRCGDARYQWNPIRCNRNRISCCRKRRKARTFSLYRYGNSWRGTSRSNVWTYYHQICVFNLVIGIYKQCCCTVVESPKLEKWIFNIIVSNEASHMPVQNESEVESYVPVHLSLNGIGRKFHRETRTNWSEISESLGGKANKA